MLYKSILLVVKFNVYEGFILFISICFKFRAFDWLKKNSIFLNLTKLDVNGNVTIVIRFDFETREVAD